MVWVINTNPNTYRHLYNKDLIQKGPWNICYTYHHITGPNNNKTFMKKKKPFLWCLHMPWVGECKYSHFAKGKRLPAAFMALHIPSKLLPLSTRRAAPASCTDGPSCSVNKKCSRNVLSQPGGGKRLVTTWLNMHAPWCVELMDGEEKNLLPHNKPTSEWCGPLLLILSTCFESQPRVALTRLRRWWEKWVFMAVLLMLSFPQRKENLFPPYMGKQCEV